MLALQLRSFGTVCLAIVYLFVFAGTPIDAQSEAPPNVLMIMTDDQGYGDLSRHGNPDIDTPNLDQLHDESVRFTDFHVSPYCSPTRASLMTGRYSARKGIWHTYGIRNLMHENETTMAEVFRSNGYRTGHFGKWHLGSNYPFAPHHRGFDVSFMLGNGGLGATDDYWGNDRFGDTYFLNGKPEPTSGFGTDNFVDRAITFRNETGDRPFFTYLATNVPHRPWNVPPAYVNAYTSTGDQPPKIGPYGTKKQTRFNGTIDKLDEQIGRLLQYLEKSGRAENTVVVFLSDNGTVNPGYNAGMRGKKTSVYDGGHRVPLFIRWPGSDLEMDRDIDKLTAHVDLLPTFIDLLNFDLPGSTEFDGYSLAPLLRNNPDTWPDDRVYITASTQAVSGYQFSLPKWKKSVVLQGIWRLINGRELYNVELDPSQENDLSEEHQKKANQLCEKYNTYRNDILPEAERIARYELGHPEQSVTTLTPMGVRTLDRDGFWGQHHVANAVRINGFWPIEIIDSGVYEFELRRWPRELDRSINSVLDKPINAGTVTGQRISPQKARLKVAGVDRTQEIDPTQPAVTFRAHLPEGKTNLQTWFISNEYESMAYYVYVEKKN